MLGEKTRTSIQLASGKPGINTSTSILNGRAEEENVQHEFTKHFKNVYTPNNGHVHASNLDSYPKMPFIDLHCLESCVKQLKRNKAAGSDGITNEHILYGSKDVCVHLCLLFNSLLRHSSKTFQDKSFVRRC